MVKISKEETEHQIRFIIRIGENLSKDIVLNRIGLETSDPRNFGISQFPAERGVEVFEVQTNDDRFPDKALWQPGAGKLQIAVEGTPAGDLKTYTGPSLEDCVRQAFSDGAFE